MFKVYRFRDLKEAGIVKNWVTLKRWIEKHWPVTGSKHQGLDRSRN